MNRAERRQVKREDRQFRARSGYTGKIRGGGEMPDELRQAVVEHVKLYGLGPCPDGDNCRITFGDDIKSVSDLNL